MAKAEVDDGNEIGSDGNGESVNAEYGDTIEVSNEDDDGDGEARLRNSPEPRRTTLVTSWRGERFISQGLLRHVEEIAEDARARHGVELHSKHCALDRANDVNHSFSTHSDH